MPFLLTTFCLAAVAALLVAEVRQHRAARAFFKTTASLCFVALAVALGAPATAFGQLMLLALVLSLVGDVCLLSDRQAGFLAGLGAFLLAHLVFALAFWAGGVSLTVAALATGPALLLGLAVLRWLRPGVSARMRGPVLAYIAAILLMGVLALAHASANGRWLVALGALIFAASDLAVARQRFLKPGFINRAWGLPAYYVAQLLLAGAVAA